MNLNIYGDDIKLDPMDMSETYQAAASIQLRTHPTHSAINFSELGKKLLESARNGDTDEVLELINGGAPFTTDWLGASPLHYAAQYGHVNTVEALLRSGIAKDARTKIDRTALHVASQEGHFETVNVLVNFGADVDAKDMLRMTPLHWAVQRGYRDIMEVLLNNGADVNIVNKFEKTPIEIAFSTGRHEVVPLLQSFKGKAKPKVSPVETATPVRLLKNSNAKRVSKTPSINRSFGSNSKIKQELADEMDIVTPINEYNGKINKTPKEKDLLQNVLSNGQTIGFTEAGKMVYNSVNKSKEQQQSTSSASSNSNGNNVNSNTKKLVIYQNQPNIVLVQSNPNQQSGKSSEGGKVVKKTPIITDLKNAKTIQVDKLPFFGKPGQGQVIKRYVINPTQTEEVKKLHEEIKNLKKELEDYKSLIISKDLEIEKLKKRIDNFDN